MADNTQLSANIGTGDVVASDDIGGVKHQRVKVEFGTDGNATDVSATDPLPINYTKSATVIETYTTPLTASASYTSATFDHSINGDFLTHFIFADVDGTHYYEVSHDGTNWIIVDTEALTGGTAVVENHQGHAKYSRARYVNGGTNQTTFYHQVIQKFIGQDEYVKIDSTQNTITGTKTHNGQSPSTNNLGVLPSIALAAAPTLTEGNQVCPRVTLTGDTAITLDGEVVVLGAGTNEIGKLAAGTAEIGKLAAGTAEIGKLAAGTAIVGKVGIDQTTPGTTNKVTVGSDVVHTIIDSGSIAATLAAGQTITDVPLTTGGLSKYHVVSAASTNAANIKASAGQVYCVTAFNLNAAARYLKFHNTAGAPTAGTGVTDTYLIPGNTAGAGVVINIDKGISFITGIGITLVTGIADADATGVAASEIVLNIYFK